MRAIAVHTHLVSKVNHIVARSYVRGVIPIEGRMIGLLDLSAVLPSLNQHAA